MIVHIPMRLGQTLHPLILEGLAINMCSVMISTVQGLPRRFNMVENWRRLFEKADADPFVGMDSDVVLQCRTLELLENTMAGHDMVVWPSGQGSLPHGLFMAKLEVVKHVSIIYLDEDTCPMCSWVQSVSRQYDVHHIPTSPLKEIRRA